MELRTHMQARVNLKRPGAEVKDALAGFEVKGLKYSLSGGSVDITPPVLNGLGGMLEAGNIYRLYTGLEVVAPSNTRFIVETTETALLNGLVVIAAKLNATKELVLYVSCINSWFFTPLFLAVVSPICEDVDSWHFEKTMQKVI